MRKDPNTPEWVQHIAFELATHDELMAMKSHLENEQIDVLGPVNHGIFDSIYFFDPNGHRLEFAVNKGTPEQLEELKSIAQEMLDEWADLMSGVGAKLPQGARELLLPLKPDAAAEGFGAEVLAALEAYATSLEEAAAATFRAQVSCAYAAGGRCRGSVYPGEAGDDACTE